MLETRESAQSTSLSSYVNPAPDKKNNLENIETFPLFDIIEEVDQHMTQSIEERQATSKAHAEPGRDCTSAYND